MVTSAADVAILTICGGVSTLSPIAIGWAARSVGEQMSL